MAGATYTCLEPYTLSLKDKGVEGLTLNQKQVSWLVAVEEVGCLIGPPVATRLAFLIGRKPVVFSAGPLCLLGWIIILFFRSFGAIFVVRLLIGILSGIVFTVTPIYTAEISEPKHRGRISGLFNIFWNLGIVLSYSLGHFLSLSSYIMASLLLPLIFTVSFVLFPETPYYLLMKKRPMEAEEVLRIFRSPGNIEKEFTDMEKAVEEEMKLKSSWGALFCNPKELKAFIVLQIVSITKFLTGMPIIMNYSSEILSHGGSYLKSGEITIVWGILLCMLSIIPAFLTDFIGRRVLMLISCYGTFLSHLLTGAYYFLAESSFIGKNYDCLLYSGMVGYCLFYNIGLGSLTQTLQAEMFTSRTRGLVAGVTQVLGAVLSFIMLMLFSPIAEAFGVYVHFWVYSGFGLIGGILLSFLMFETKGKTIGRMQNMEMASS